MKTENVQDMIDNHGLWVAVNPLLDWGMVPIYSFNGKLYAMKIDHELSPDGFTMNNTYHGPIPEREEQ